MPTLCAYHQRIPSCNIGKHRADLVHTQQVAARLAMQEVDAILVMQKVDAIYASDLARAQETLHIIRNALPSSVHVRLSKQLVVNTLLFPSKTVTPAFSSSSTPGW